MVFKKIKDKNVATVCFSCSSNNTIGTIVDKHKNVLLSFSCGGLGYKGSKKGSASAAHHLAFFLGQEALKLGHSSVNLKIRGFGRGRNSLVKNLLKSGVTIYEIFERSPVVFNGCRVAKGKA